MLAVRMTSKKCDRAVVTIDRKSRHLHFLETNPAHARFDQLEQNILSDRREIQWSESICSDEKEAPRKNIPETEKKYDFIVNIMLNLYKTQQTLV